MASPGAGVLRDNGKAGLIPSGKSALFDTAGDCTVCCLPSTPWTCDYCTGSIFTPDMVTSWDVLFPSIPTLGSSGCVPDDPDFFKDKGLYRFDHDPFSTGQSCDRYNNDLGLLETTTCNSGASTWTFDVKQIRQFHQNAPGVPLVFNFRVNFVIDGINTGNTAWFEVFPESGDCRRTYLVDHVATFDELQITPIFT